MDTTTLSFEQIQEIEDRLKEPELSWEELRLYSRIKKKLLENEVDITHV